MNKIYHSKSAMSKNVIINMIISGGNLHLFFFNKLRERFSFCDPSFFVVFLREVKEFLVSITTLTATFFFTDLFYSLDDIGFYFFLGILCGLLMYSLYNTVKPFLPFITEKDPDFNLLMFFYIHLLERFKHPIFKDSMYYFRHNWATFFGASMILGIIKTASFRHDLLPLNTIYHNKLAIVKNPKGEGL